MEHIFFLKKLKTCLTPSPYRKLSDARQKRAGDGVRQVWPSQVLAGAGEMWSIARDRTEDSALPEGNTSADCGRPDESEFGGRAG